MARNVLDHPSLFPSVAADGALQPPALLLYASGVFWTLGYDTIYAVQDLEDDALAGVKSSARRLGAQAPLAILAFYLASLALLLGMGLVGGLAPTYYLGLIGYGICLFTQVRRLRLDDPARALRLFKLNAFAGLVLTVSIVAGTRLLAAT
jgi:4-hydroxybenzoate polyprenyltransferase